MYRDSLKPETNYPPKLAQHIAKTYIPSSSADVLDLGCGRGEIASALQSLGFMVVGADLSIPNRARERNASVTWKELNGDQELPFPDEEFDFIFTKSVIEHQREPELFLSECFRILKTGGRLLVLTPDWVRNKSRFFDDHTHVTPFTKISLTNILSLAGFDQVDCRYLLQLPAVWNSRSLRLAATAVGGVVPYWVNFKPLRWSRERQLAGLGVKP